MGAQWLSDRVLDLRPRVCGFEASPASLHCVLEQETLILAKYWFKFQPRKTCPYITEKLLMGRKESNQTVLALTF